MGRSQRDLAPFIIPLIVLIVAVLAVLMISSTPRQWDFAASTQTNPQENLFAQATYTSPLYALDTDFLTGAQILDVTAAQSGGSQFITTITVTAPSTGNFFVYKNAYVTDADGAWSAVTLVSDAPELQGGAWNTSWIFGSATGSKTSLLAGWTDPSYVSVYTCTEYSKTALFAVITDLGERAKLNAHFGNNEYAYICGFKGFTSTAVDKNKWRIATFNVNAAPPPSCTNTSTNASVCGANKVCGFVSDSCNVARYCGTCPTPAGHDAECVTKICSANSCSYTNKTGDVCNTAGISKNQVGTCAGGLCAISSSCTPSTYATACAGRVCGTVANGTCAGTFTCLPNTCGAGTCTAAGTCTNSCTPTTETCNGVDDDCDTQVDEGSLCTTPKTCGGTSGCVCPTACTPGTISCVVHGVNSYERKCVSQSGCYITQETLCSDTCINGVGCANSPPAGCNSATQCTGDGSTCTNFGFFGQVGGVTKYCDAGTWLSCAAQYECRMDDLFGVVTNCYFTNGAYQFIYSAPTEVCNDGHDNDCLGGADCQDSSCLTATACSSSCIPALKEDCSDGVDNTCDALIDGYDTAFCPHYVNCNQDFTCANPDQDYSQSSNCLGGMADYCFSSWEGVDYCIPEGINYESRTDDRQYCYNGKLYYCGATSQGTTLVGSGKKCVYENSVYKFVSINYVPSGSSTS